MHADFVAFGAHAHDLQEGVFRLQAQHVTVFRGFVQTPERSVDSVVLPERDTVSGDAHGDEPERGPRVLYRAEEVDDHRLTAVLELDGPPGSFLVVHLRGQLE